MGKRVAEGVVDEKGILKKHKQPDPRQPAVQQQPSSAVLHQQNLTMVGLGKRGLGVAAVADGLLNGPDAASGEGQVGEGASPRLMPCQQWRLSAAEDRSMHGMTPQFGNNFGLLLPC
jgi:hypothetical protein